MCGISFGFSCPTVVCIDDDTDDDDDELTLTNAFGNDWAGVTAATDDDEDADDDGGFVVAFTVVVVVVGMAAFVIDVDDVDGYWKTFGCEAAFDVDFGVSPIECCCDA